MFLSLCLLSLSLFSRCFIVSDVCLITSVHLFPVGRHVSLSLNALAEVQCRPVSLRVCVH